MREAELHVDKILFPELAVENRKTLETLRNNLKKTQKENAWMLGLGAGVSISAKLPNWTQLLAKLFAQLFPLEGSSGCRMSGYNGAHRVAVDRFYRDLGCDANFSQKFSDALEGNYSGVFEKTNLLEAAEYIRNFLKESMNASEEIVNSYLNRMIQQACRTDMSVEPTNMELRYSTLAAVARLMKSEKDHLIHNVITYNYDNLLETYLRNVCGCADKDVHSIDKKDDLRGFGGSDGWNIYHVHGRIPVIPHPGEEMSDRVILTESDYYQEEEINYSWTNILQAYAMFRSNMIFIGFSGTDYNFRRIIKYVNREKAMEEGKRKHYIFFSINDIVNAVFSKEVESGRKFEDCLERLYKGGNEYAFEKFFINYLVFAQTSYWQTHGLNVIWSSHNELYKDLETLHMV